MKTIFRYLSGSVIELILLTLSLILLIADKTYFLAIVCLYLIMNIREKGILRDTIDNNISDPVLRKKFGLYPVIGFKRVKTTFAWVVDGIVFLGAVFILVAFAVYKFGR